MTRDELARAVARQSGVEIEVAQKVVKATFETMRETIKSGESLFVRGFGSFTRKYKGAKTGRDIGRQKNVDIPARFAPHVKFAKSFTDSMPRPKE